MANGGGAFSAVEIIDLLITAALMPMFLFMPVPAPLGQWRRVLTCQAPAADPALELVRRALEQHATPMTTTDCARWLPRLRPAVKLAGVRR